jgi:hypothetical protein
MNIPDHIFESFGLKILKFCYGGSGSGIRNLFDPGSGMERFGSGIRYKHSGSATLLLCDPKYRLYTDIPICEDRYCSCFLNIKLTVDNLEMKLFVFENQFSNKSSKLKIIFDWYH